MSIAQKTNDICDRLDVLNGTILKHEQRISKLKAKVTFCGQEGVVQRMKGRIRGHEGYITFAMLAGGALYALGCALDWW